MNRYILLLSSLFIVPILTYSQDVGIGTASPSEKLDVDGAVRIGNTVTTNPGTIRWTGSDFEGYDGSQWLSLTSGAAADNDWAAVGGGSPSLTGNVFHTGQVGINTTSTNASLDVRGSAIFNEDGGSNDFRIEGVGLSHLFYTQALADNIGIGTSSPFAQAMLHLQPNNTKAYGLYVTHNLTSSTIAPTGIYVDVDNNNTGFSASATGIHTDVYTTGAADDNTYGTWIRTRNAQTGTGSRTVYGVYNLASLDNFVVTPSTSETYASYNSAVGYGYNTIGVFGSADVTSPLYSQNAYGIYGRAVDAVNNYAGYFIANDATGTTNYGVYATASSATTNWAGYFNGSVFTTGSYLPSDSKLKSDIQSYSGGLDDLMKVDVKTYYYNKQKYSQLELPEDRQIGLIAENLEVLFPQLVTENHLPGQDVSLQNKGIDEIGSAGQLGVDAEIMSTEVLDFKAVNYAGLVPVLVQAIQELNQKLEEQENIMKQQQEEIDELKNK